MIDRNRKPPPQSTGELEDIDENHSLDFIHSRNGVTICLKVWSEDIGPIISPKLSNLTELISHVARLKKELDNIEVRAGIKLLQEPGPLFPDRQDG